MTSSSFAPLCAEIRSISPMAHFGLVTETSAGLVLVSGLSHMASVGDLVEVKVHEKHVCGEIVDVNQSHIYILAENGTYEISVGDRVRYLGSRDIRPDLSWVGRVIDPYGEPLDGRSLVQGNEKRAILCRPPPAADRKRLGKKLETGVTALNTFLPLVKGQRVGLFAGSGVGKSTLLATLAKHIEADFIVIAMVGERGKEVREFIEDTLGPEGLKRSILVVATSDRPAAERRRAAWAAVSVAEFLREQGAHVLLLVDSVTRFCEAHREIASAAGETSSIRGYPPSTNHALMALCERCGPGPEDQGDITAVLSVLVTGSNMEEPVADMARGVLDGHIILDRSIAERGRFPAIDILRSVSRSFGDCSSEKVEELVKAAKQSMAAYDQAEIMIQSGLYQTGTDESVDAAIALRPKLEAFLSGDQNGNLRRIEQDIESLSNILVSQK